MKKRTLLSTAAAALLLTAGAVSAQGMKKDEAPAHAPTAQQNAPAEKVAPPMKPGAATQKEPEHAGKKPNQTTGQAPSGDMDKGAMTNSSEKPSGAEPKAKHSGDTTKGGHAEMNKNKESTAQSPNGANTNAAQGPAGSKSDRSATTQPSRETTGQGAAAGAAHLSTEQRTKITTIIRRHKVAPAHVDFDIRVGTRVPRTVHFYPLPTEVVEVYPEWRGYDYILVGEQIIVVNPRTHEIVAILET